jgi:hypothetical protein
MIRRDELDNVDFSDVWTGETIASVTPQLRVTLRGKANGPGTGVLPASPSPLPSRAYGSALRSLHGKPSGADIITRLIVTRVISPRDVPF